MALNRRVSLNDPEEDAIRRRQRLADSLMQQSVDPIQIQNYQGIQAPIPVTEGLNKVLAGALGGYEDKRATQEGEDLRTRRKDEAAKYVKALDGWTNPDAGTPGNEAPAQVPLTPDARKQLLLQGLTSDNERVQGAAGTLYSSDQQEAQQKRALEAQQAAAQAAYQNQVNLRGIPQAAPPAQVLPPDVEAQRIRMAQAGVKQNEMPSSLQEWAAFQKMSPEQQTQYLTMKRANPAINLGGSQQIINPANPGGAPIANIPTTLKPGEEPAVRGAQSEASAVGTGAGNAQVQASNQARGAGKTLGLLDGVEDLIDKSVGSGAGAAAAAAGNFVGSSSEAADATAALKVLQGNIMLAMPRMEGPQSDRDTQLYRDNAAQLAEPIPASQRKKAVAEIRRIQEKYKSAGTNAPSKADDPLGLR